MSDKPLKTPGADVPLPKGWIRGLYENLPYEGPPLNLKNEDGEERRPQLDTTVRVRTFQLANEKDLIAYEKVMQALADGTAMISLEKVEYNEAVSNWDILLRWLEYKYTAPKEF